MTTPSMPARFGDLPPIGRPAGRALFAAGITTVEQAAATGRRALLAMHGVGPKAVGILAEAIAARGLEFSD